MFTSASISRRAKMELNVFMIVTENIPVSALKDSMERTASWSQGHVRKQGEESL